MNANIDHEKIFFNYFLNKPQYLKKINKGVFKNNDLDYVANLAKKFFLKFDESPSKEQLTALLDDDDAVDNDIVNAIYNVNINEYDQDWLKRTSEAWIKWKHFDKQLIKTIEYVKTQSVTPENVEDVVGRAINMISTDGSITFDVDVGLDFFNPESHSQNQNKKIQTGWSFIDNVSNGGYDPKSLIVYAGEQNIGKSIWLANDACNFVRMGHNVVFITAEMSAQKVVKRIGSNLLNISINEYDKKSVNKDFIKQKLDKISKGLLPPGKLFVKEFPTSQATVQDIELYLKELEESQDYKINVVIIDYINILANHRNPNSENTYMKIKQIAEDLRALAVKKDVLIISATQINRGGWDSTEIRIENIAESAGLAHTVDVMYGIIQDSVMHLDRIYWLKVLKIRDGHGRNTKCKFEINYDYMRITETGEIIN